MRGRCLNPRNEKFPLYGGRGIKIDPAWDSYEQFLKDMGRRPAGTTLERKDVNADYGLGNCIWASQKTQQNNRRNNLRIEHGGQSKTLAEWAAHVGMNYIKLRKRLILGWSFEDAIQATTRTRTPKL